MERKLTFEEAQAKKRRRAMRGASPAPAPAAQSDDAPPSEDYTTEKVANGSYNVVATDGSVQNAEPMKKKAAKDLAAELNAGGPQTAETSEPRHDGAKSQPDAPAPNAE